MLPFSSILAINFICMMMSLPEIVVTSPLILPFGMPQTFHPVITEICLDKQVRGEFDV